MEEVPVMSGGRNPEFQRLLDNMKRVKAEAAKTGKDPKDVAKAELAQHRAEVLDLEHLLNVLGIEGVTCPLCVQEQQQMCVQGWCPSTEDRQRNLVGAWQHGFHVGFQLKDRGEEAEKRLIAAGCDRHRDDLWLMILAAKGDWIGP
jgi:hypothetical protein